MARLRQVESDDEELPELQDLIRSRRLPKAQATHDKKTTPETTGLEVKYKNTKRSIYDENATIKHSRRVKQTPKRSAKRKVIYKPTKDLNSSSEAEIQETTFCSSAESDDGTDSMNDVVSKVRKASIAMPPPSAHMRNIPFSQPEGIFDLTSPELANPRPLKQQLFHPSPITNSCSRPSSSSEAENPAILRFSPPRSRSPIKVTAPSRPITPPQDPTKTRLVSPSKKNRIPPTPHRPSIDAFWSQEFVNEWNDQHSPRKILVSPKRNGLRRPTPESENEGFPSPSVSPRKGQSPTKKNRAEIEAKKSFDVRKIKRAESFLKELDERVASGKIAEMAKETGGVKIVWSKKLNSTAGRANWRREGLRSKTENGESTIRYRHEASIELAEKIIENDDRLLNVLAHEYCHLLTFMISNIRDQPHGKAFKEWGAKVSAAFRDQNIVVTTKHSYDISYKYVWECVNCGIEFKRHSKSIDPKKHKCGACRSELVQVKPVPRKGVKKEGDGDEKGKMSSYQSFVKENMTRVRKELSGKPTQRDVMEALGREYRKMKAGSEVSHAVRELSEGGL
ncbi:hypothetical protein M501DRAFT_1007638 [Patellaria atrata CBS 101060]|uniref:SprT-like domain-containing protein n=1 Tax=Patellaria atrata CBS 101060 TaxID=1346257 RepID=A0A9P4VJY3_9PEZI|nr:hypothetical protein M501DRAFT_1007638 [Patellaria atrata CBS 101060]